MRAKGSLVKSVEFVYSFRVSRADEKRAMEALESLLAQVEKSGERGLGIDALDQLGALYRQAAARLAEARRLGTDRARIRYLDALVRRAHFVIYAPPKRGLRPLQTLITGGFAVAFRETARLQALAAALFFVGALLAYIATQRSVEVAYPIMGLMFPAELVQGLIESAEVREAYITTGRSSGVGIRSAFALMLVVNNTRVGFMAFSLGIAAGVPTVLIQTFNGAVLGAMAGLYDRGGVDLAWWAWVLPHGIPEVLALCICAAAGLLIGRAVVDPQGRPRAQALVLAGRTAAVLITFAALLLIYAGIIEGYFRQFAVGNGPRFALAALNGLALALYLGFAGRRT